MVSNAHRLSAAALCVILSLGGACADGPEPVRRPGAPEEMGELADMAIADAGVEVREGVRPEPPPSLGAACGEGAQDVSDLRVCTATYLAGEGEDELVGVAITRDGGVVFGGMLPGVPTFGPVVLEHSDQGDGVVVKLSATGRRIEGWVRMGLVVSAIASSPHDGSVVVAGDFGLAVLEPTLEAVRHETIMSAAQRIDVGFGGEIVALTGRRVTVFDATLSEVLGSFDVTDDHVEDLAFDSWNQRVIVAGYNQVGASLQQPYLRGYSLAGEVMWRAWDWSAEQAAAYGSDTRLTAVSLGKDGKLYVAGEAHGGATVFSRDAQSLEREAPNTRADAYSDPFRLKGAAPIGYVARLDLGGRLERGTFLLTRLASGEGNAARPMSLEADEAGRVVVGGESACCIEAGEQKRVAGQEAMPGYAGGAFVAVFEGEALERTLWTTFHGGAAARTRGVAAWGGRMVSAQEHVAPEGESQLQGKMITHEPVMAEPQGGEADVHLVVWPW